MVPRVGSESGVAHCELVVSVVVLELGAGAGVGIEVEVGLGGLGGGHARTGQLAGVKGSVAREVRRAVRRQRWQRAWPHRAGGGVGCGLER